MASLLDRITGKAELKAALDVMRRNVANNLTLINSRTTRTQYKYDGNGVQDYLNNAHVYMIIKKIASTTARIPFYCYEVVDESKLKQYKSLTANFATSSDKLGAVQELKYLQTKALEELPDTDAVNKILATPNPNMSAQEYREGIYTFLDLQGEWFEMLQILDAGANAGRPYSMYLLPPCNTALLIAEGWPIDVVGYETNINGVKLYKGNDVIHGRYFNPNFTVDGSELRGLSPLQAAKKLTTMSNSEIDAGVAQFQNGGAEGVVYNKSLQPDESSVETLSKQKADYYNESTGVINYKKKLFLAGEIGYVKFGSDMVDMQLAESRVSTFRELCGIWGIDPKVINDSAASTYENYKTAMRSLYTNCCLPRAFMARDNYNRKLLPMFKDGVRRFIDCDITGITELQSDMKDMATVAATIPFMKPNDILEQFHFEKSDEPGMDQYWIKSGYQPIEDAMSMGTIPTPAVQDYIQNPLK